MKKKILVIGKNSFLARGFLKRAILNDSLDVTSHYHSEIPYEMHKFDFVLNFSFNPRLYNDNYQQEFDQDLRIANIIRNYNDTKLMVFSSRQVYGIHEKLKVFSETDINLNSDISKYGLNKLKSEKKVRDCIGDDSRLIVCRSSNIFGDNLNGSNFMDIAVKSLLTSNIISLDSSKNVVKDFLPLEIHSEIIESLILKNLSGIYNIGSGKKITLGEICNSLIDGYKSGTIIDEENINDQFSLDVSKIQKYIDINLSSKDILEYAKNIGRRHRKRSYGF